MIDMIKLGGPDKVSMDFIARTRLFVAPGIADQDGVRKVLCEWYFSNRKALFGRHTPEEMQDFRDAAGVDWSDDETYAVIQYFVQRVRNYAHLETLGYAGFEFASVVSHGDDCGREDERISVRRAIEQLGNELSIPQSDYENEVYGRDTGMPPFTMKCTCRLEGLFG